MVLKTTKIQGQVPPGQHVTEKWPVLHYGSIPRFNAATWDFRIFGLVDEPRTLTYEEFMALPHSTRTCDILAIIFTAIRGRKSAIPHRGNGAAG